MAVRTQQSPWSQPLDHHLETLEAKGGWSVPREKVPGTLSNPIQPREGRVEAEWGWGLGARGCLWGRGEAQDWGHQGPGGLLRSGASVLCLVPCPPALFQAGALGGWGGQD